jgi:hypothetical protein
MSILKKCVVCGKEFTAGNEKGIYCSGKCRSKAQRMREKELFENVSNEEYDRNDTYNALKADNNLLTERLYEAEKQIMKLNQELQIIIKYVMDFTVSAAKITYFEEKQTQFKELINNFEIKIAELKKLLYDRTEKNEDNIRNMALYLNEMTNKINSMTDKINSMSENNHPDVLDRLLNNDKIMALLSRVLSGNSEQEKLNP